MNSCMFLKVFEYCLLPEMSRKLKISKHQFGYKKQTGCLQAIALAKETIFKYNSENSHVHCAAVDLSKAFDKINHKILFAKLHDSNLRPEVVRIIKVMYEQSYVNTSFNGVSTSSWRIGNGVRQGGILSPIYFLTTLIKLFKR